MENSYDTSKTTDKGLHSTEHTQNNNNLSNEEPHISPRKTNNNSRINEYTMESQQNKKSMMQINKWKILLELTTQKMLNENIAKTAYKQIEIYFQLRHQPALLSIEHVLQYKKEQRYDELMTYYMQKMLQPLPEGSDIIPIN